MTSTYRYCLHCGAACSPVARTCFACRRSLLITPILAEHPDLPSVSQKRETFAHGTLIKEQYRLLKVVGQGGFGTVYQATDLLNARIVAVKAIHLAGLTTQQVLEATESFQRETSLLSRLRHPHLPRIFDTFAQASYWYLIMEFIEGEMLEDYMLRQQSSTNSAQAGLPLDEVLDIGLQLCHVLNYLHTQQPPIIFRDLKPGNIMRTPSGHLFLIDFGIARHFKPERAKDTSPLGSPGYAAPEQYGKAQTTPRADIYSLGALLYYLLTGIDPAEGLFHFAALPPALAPIDRIIRPMLEMDEHKRPRDVTVIEQELQRLKHRVPDELISIPAQRSPRQHRDFLSRRAIVAGLTTLGVGAVAAHFLFPSIASLGVPQSQTISVYGGHKANVLYMTWSPDSTRIASLDQNNLLHIWSIVQAKRLFVIPPVTTMTSCIPAGIGWSPNSRYVACCCEEEPVHIRVWDTVTGHMQSSYTGPAYATCEGNALAWSPDGTRIASGGDTGTVHIWEALTGKPLAIHASSTLQNVYYLAWSPDGTRIAGTPARGPVVVLDAQNGNALFSYHDTNANGTSWHTSLAWSPDGRYLTSGVGGNDSKVEIHSGISGKHITTYTGETSSNGICQVHASWPSRGLRVASYMYNPARIEMWPIGNERAFTYWSISSLDVEWSPDGRYIASSNDDYTIQVWKAP